MSNPSPTVLASLLEAVTTAHYLQLVGTLSDKNVADMVRITLEYGATQDAVDEAARDGIDGYKLDQRTH